MLFHQPNSLLRMRFRMIEAGHVADRQDQRASVGQGDVVGLVVQGIFPLPAAVARKHQFLGHPAQGAWSGQHTLKPVIASLAGGADPLRRQSHHVQAPHPRIKSKFCLPGLLHRREQVPDVLPDTG